MKILHLSFVMKSRIIKGTRGSGEEEKHEGPRRWEGSVGFRQRWRLINVEGSFLLTPSPAG